MKIFLRLFKKRWGRCEGSGEGEGKGEVFVVGKGEL